MLFKRFVLVLFASAACLGVAACEEEAQPPEEEQQPAQPSEQPAQPAPEQPAAEPAQPGPADICKQMVEAANAKDETKLTSLMTETSADVLTGQGVKDAMTMALAGGECGEANVAEDGAKATVPLKTGEETRELPFLKTEQGWRFDAAAYNEKYPVEKQPAKAKKGKKAKKAKLGKKAKKKK